MPLAFHHFSKSSSFLQCPSQKTVATGNTFNSNSTTQLSLRSGQQSALLKQSSNSPKKTAPLPPLIESGLTQLEIKECQSVLLPSPLTQMNHWTSFSFWTLSKTIAIREVQGMTNIDIPPIMPPAQGTTSAQESAPQAPAPSKTTPLPPGDKLDEPLLPCEDAPPPPPPLMETARPLPVIPPIEEIYHAHQPRTAVTNRKSKFSLATLAILLIILPCFESAPPIPLLYQTAPPPLGHHELYEKNAQALFQGPRPPQELYKPFGSTIGSGTKGRRPPPNCHHFGRRPSLYCIFRLPARPRPTPTSLPSFQYHPATYTNASTHYSGIYIESSTPTNQPASTDSRSLSLDELNRQTDSDSLQYIDTINSKNNKPNAIRNKREISLLPTTQSPTPLRLSDSVITTYENTLFMATGAKDLKIKLPFSAILDNILHLYNFTTNLGDISRIDTTDFTALDPASLGISNDILNDTSKIRLYENYDRYDNQIGICQTLGLTHISPLPIKSHLSADISYFLPIEIYSSPAQISCQIDNVAIIGKDCIKKIVQLSQDNNLITSFQNEHKLYDRLVNRPAAVYHVTVSKTRLDLVPMNTESAILCQGALSQRLGTHFKSTRHFNNLFYSQLSSIYINLIDSIHLHYLSLEELFFQSLPTTKVAIRPDTSAQDLIKDIHKYLPDTLSTFSGTRQNTMSPHTETLLNENIIRDSELMTLFRTLRSQPTSFWQSHSTPQLFRIVFALRTLYLDSSTTLHFFTNKDSNESARQLPLPLQQLTPDNITPLVYGTSLSNLAQKNIPERELVFINILLRNNLVEALHNLKPYINMGLDIPNYVSVSSLLHKHKKSPEKRQTRSHFSSTPTPTKVTTTIPTTTAPPDNNAPHNSTASSTPSSTTPSTTSPPPQMQTIKGSYSTNYKHNRVKRSFWSSMLGLVSYDDLHDVTEDERKLLREQEKLISHVHLLETQNDAFHDNIAQFKDNIQSFESTDLKLQNKLADIISAETAITSEIKVISQSLEASVSTAIQFMQLNGGIISLMHQLETLTSGVQSILDQTIPINLLSNTKLYEIIPLHTSISLQFATITSSLDQLGHCLHLTLPEIKDYYLSYQITTIPYLVTTTNATSAKLQWHKYHFPTKYVAMSPNHAYFEYDQLPCSKKQSTILCHPKDVTVHPTDHTCYSELINNPTSPRCLGWLSVSTSAEPPQEYVYSKSRKYVLIFSPHSETATLLCDHFPSIIKGRSFNITQGLAKYSLPYHCSIHTSQLFILSASLLQSDKYSIEISPQNVDFTNDVLNAHMLLGQASETNITMLLHTVDDYQTELHNVHLTNLTTTLLHQQNLHDVASFQPFKINLHNPSALSFWIQMLGLLFGLLCLTGCCICACGLCPCFSGCFVQLITNITNSCCFLIKCCQTQSTTYASRLNFRTTNSIDQSHLHLRQPSPGSPILEPPAYHELRLPPPQKNPPPPTLRPRQAPNPFEETSFIDLDTPAKRTSLVSADVTWSVNAFNERLRISAQNKGTLIFYNTLQKCIVNILDNPHTDPAIYNLPFPNNLIINKYALLIEDKPRPKVSLIANRIQYGTSIFWDETDKCWRQIVSRRPVDGLRPPH